MEKDFFTSHRAMVKISVRALMRRPFFVLSLPAIVEIFPKNSCRMMIDYRVLSGIGQIIIGIDSDFLPRA
jgi:hypothetical protein